MCGTKCLFWSACVWKLRITKNDSGACQDWLFKAVKVIFLCAGSVRGPCVSFKWIPCCCWLWSGNCTVSYLIEKLMAIYHFLALIGFLCPCGAVNWMCPFFCSPSVANVVISCIQLSSYGQRKYQAKHAHHIPLAINVHYDFKEEKLSGCFKHNFLFYWRTNARLCRGILHY